jgi:hypothetical protein
MATVTNTDEAAAKNKRASIKSSFIFLILRVG